MVIVFIIMTNNSGCSGGRSYQQRIAETRRNHAAAELKSKTEIPAARFESDKPSYAPIKTPLTVDAAVSYALRHNLDAKVKELERDILEESLSGERLKMLPALVFDGEINYRDSYDASYSDPLFSTGQQDFNYSRDKSTSQYQIELSWDILNFGLAFYQQKQAMERFNMAEQRHRRVVQNLKFDVVKTYWQAVAAKKAKIMAQIMIERLKVRADILKDQLKNQTVSEIPALKISVAISEMMRDMSRYAHEFRRLKNKLATHMGLPQHREFEIADVRLDRLKLKKVSVDIPALEIEALEQRPELYEQDMEERVSIDDARVAIARAMPRSSFYYRYSYDGDSHLYEDQWYEAGIRLSFDLLSVPRQFSQRRQALLKKQMIQTRRQAMAAAILTQLRLSVIDFEEAWITFKFSEEIKTKQKKLMEAQVHHATFGNVSAADVVEQEARYLFAYVHSLIAKADLLIAEQRILNSIGWDRESDHDRFFHTVDDSSETENSFQLSPKRVTKQPER